MPRYFELDVALQEIQPRIWRRLLIRTTSTFAHLHNAIQQSFGWQDYHLWEFRLPTFNGAPIAGVPQDEDFGRPTPDARQVKLSSYFTGKNVTEWCEYLYDFGDDWCHDVKLVRVVSDKESFKQRLLAGERACPPEDCGGASGYERMVHFVQTGEDILEDDPEGLRTWLMGWQPDAFDLGVAEAKFDR